MDENADPNRYDEKTLARGQRFLGIVSGIVLVVALVVATVNLIAYRYMLHDQNQDIVQLLAGWGRMYKPILYDEIRPQVAVYGASWARDAFDPVTTGQLLGKTFFNHGVSGGSPYETRRFGDASLDNPALEAAIINLDTFYRDRPVARNRYGFDESILDVDPERNPRSWVGLKRIYSLTLTGWAAGANVELIRTIFERDRGAARPEYLEAYEQADHVRHQGAMDLARQRIFPEPGSPAVAAAPQAAAAGTIETSAELDWMIDGFCASGIDVYAYFTPSPARHLDDCDPQAREPLAALRFLRQKQRSCDATIRFFDFDYPNAVTLEGVLTPVRRSRYYRPDGHPRPTVGLLMAARMFERDFPPDTHAMAQQDFGVDLMSHPDAEVWLRERAARCEGNWGENGFQAYKDALTRP